MDLVAGPRARVDGARAASYDLSVAICLSRLTAPRSSLSPSCTTRANRQTATAFLKALLEAVPYKIRPVKRLQFGKRLAHHAQPCRVRC